MGWIWVGLVVFWRVCLYLGGFECIRMSLVGFGRVWMYLVWLRCIWFCLLDLEEFGWFWMGLVVLDRFGRILECLDVFG